jgi:hypothetical protein
MEPSLRDKRLQRELPLLPYKTEWNVGENVVLVPEHGLTIRVTSWYPFRCPTIEVHGEPENTYLDRFRNNNNDESRRRISYDWCPSYGIQDLVDDYLKELAFVKVEKHATDAPA